MWTSKFPPIIGKANTSLVVVEAIFGNLYTDQKLSNGISSRQFRSGTVKFGVIRPRTLASADSIVEINLYECLLLTSMFIRIIGIPSTNRKNRIFVSVAYSSLPHGIKLSA